MEYNLIISRADCGLGISLNKTGFKRVVKKLWPDLEMIVMVSGGNMRIYTEQIRKYTGDIKLYSPVYAIPECTIGYDIHNDGMYCVDPRKGYFEFIHIDTKYLEGDVTDKKAVAMSSLKIGELYNIVVSTTLTDLQRYVTGEIVRVMGYVNGSPKIDVICNEHDLLFAKQKIITPHDIELILFKDFRLIDYCYRKVEGSKLKLYIEISYSGYLQDNTRVYDVRQDIKDIDILDHLLDQIGLDAEVRIVMPKTFEMMYQSKYMETIEPSIIQMPRRMTNKEDIDILRENILYMYS